jgi:hypothetical protein
MEDVQNVGGTPGLIKFMIDSDLFEGNRPSAGWSGTEFLPPGRCVRPPAVPQLTASRSSVQHRSQRAVYEEFHTVPAASGRPPRGGAPPPGWMSAAPLCRSHTGPPTRAAWHEAARWSSPARKASPRGPSPCCCRRTVDQRRRSEIWLTPPRNQLCLPVSTNVSFFIRLDPSMSSRPCLLIVVLDFVACFIM